MRIAIDARPLETGHRFRGIGVYAENLIKNISVLDSKNDYIFLTQQKISAASKLVDKSNLHYQDQLIRQNVDSTRYYWYADQIYLPQAIKKSQADVVHFLDQLSAPLGKAAKTIITVHDLIQLVEQGSDFKTNFKFKPVKTADLILVPSAFTQNELVKRFQIAPDKMRMIAYAYDQNSYQLPKNLTRVADFKKKLLKNQFDKYLLYVGAVGEKRKNLLFLLEVFAEVIKNNPKEKVALILVGKAGPGFEKVQEKIKKLNIAKQVISTDFVQDLPIYFQGAEIFLFPSLYEGFGLPPLEAMACGVPVISSDATSLSEVVENGGILLSPTDKSGWIKAINQVLQDEKLKRRLIHDGINQAKKFSWQKTAEKTIKVYEELGKL